MLQSVEIRTARPADIDQLMDLYRTHLNSNNPHVDVDEHLMSHWQAILDNPMLTYIVADSAGRLAGTCNLTVVPNLTHGLRPYGVIENVVTHADYRRKGVGKRLIEATLSIAWERGCYKVMLLSGAGRVDAHRFYESLGFDGDKKKGYVAFPPEI